MLKRDANNFLEYYNENYNAMSAYYKNNADFKGAQGEDGNV